MVSASPSVDRFVRQCATIAPRLNAGARNGVFEAALTVTGSIRRELGSDTGGRNMLRGVGRKGAKLSVGFDIKGTQNPTALVQARGPWQLLERNTKSHSMARRTGNVYVRGRNAQGRVTHTKTDKTFNRAAKGLVQVIPGVGPRNAAGFKPHPGTTGKHTFEHGVDRAIPVAEAIVARNTFATYAGVFK